MALFFENRNNRGRHVLGDEVFLSVQCTSTSGVPTAPDAAPVMTIYDDTGARVLQKSIPPVERYTATGLFGYMQQMNSSFATGRHWVLYTYSVSTNQRNNLDTFEVVTGGNVAGQVISLHYVEQRDSQDWIIGQCDSGTLVYNRGPKIT